MLTPLSTCCVSYFLRPLIFNYNLCRYEQLIDHTKALNGRTYKLVSQLLEHAQGQAAR